MTLTLVTGPVRSGKSALAQRLAQQTRKHVRYLATAARDPLDTEWEARMARHAADRPAGWEIVETAAMPGRALDEMFDTASDATCIVFDSLGTWLANEIVARRALLEVDSVTAAAELEGCALQLARGMARCRGDVIAVGEQVGWDVVPAAASARVFRDTLGRMQQQLAKSAAQAYLVVCGYAIDIKTVGETTG